ncbi:MAG: sulfatase-like hydrolase/transferase [Acidobacteria bacterium]|nr:sulfatase-like hydrolase/transferase [Acidobacteriota bacterium]
MGTGIATAGNASTLGALQDSSARAGGRPNFLFVICDDLAFRTIGSLNNHEVHTPNLDRLSASGCTFTHCFHQGSWSAAVCVPSRTMLNSGLGAFRAQAGLDDVPTWGQTLGNAGYDTYICGKWHLDPTVLQRSFKEMGPIGPGMFESTPISGAAYNRPSPGNTWEPWDETQKGHWVHTSLWRNEKLDRIEHADVLYTDYFVDHLLNKAAKRDAPFFMYLGLNSPHDPRQSFKEDLALYPQDKIEIPPNFLPEHPFDQGDSRIRDEVLAPFPRTKEAVQLHRREYYALITLLDAQVGRVLDALQRSGKASNTYVIFTADHGLAVGEHGLMGKQNLYDCSVRMPLLIAGPGVTPGSRVDELVYQHSMYATTCELAKAPVPDAVQFPSLVSLLHGSNRAVHEAIFCYYRDFQRMVRTKKYKFIVYPKIQRVQLFDVESDPWEMHDLSNDSAHASTKQEMSQLLVRMQKDLDDPMLRGKSTAGAEG